MRRKAAAGDAKAPKAAAVETSDDGLLRDLADFRGFSGRKDCLHDYLRSKLLNSAKTAQGSSISLFIHLRYLNIVHRILQLELAMRTEYSKNGQDWENT